MSEVDLKEPFIPFENEETIAELEYTLGIVGYIQFMMKHGRDTAEDTAKQLKELNKVIFEISETPEAKESKAVIDKFDYLSGLIVLAQTKARKNHSKQTMVDVDFPNITKEIKSLVETLKKGSQPNDQ